VKSVLSIALLLFVAVCLVYAFVSDRGSNEVSPEAPPVAATDVAAVPPSGDVSTGETHSPEAAPTPAAKPKLVAYYFHGDFRCNTCRAMERFAREAVEKDFADELKQGSVEWRAVNYDKSENEHYIKTYELSASAVVVALVVDGSPKRWRKLDLIWDLVGNEFAYKAYIVTEIEEMMEEGA